jgi:hypothetical protein
MGNKNSLKAVRPLKGMPYQAIGVNRKKGKGATEDVMLRNATIEMGTIGVYPENPHYFIQDLCSCWVSLEK